ncbi:MAG: hypothetical protein EOP88_01270 [Verrucomicrobiaceae bacterium]|nr:MAG: hypothetical protein EOP88_01270 [Verrucomicrobiaceae bacterium]
MKKPKNAAGAKEVAPKSKRTVATKATKAAKAAMAAEDDQEVRTLPLDLLPRHLRANNDVLESLERIAVLAGKGDMGAIRHWHSIACAMVERLNSGFLDYSATATEWAVLVPQDRTVRAAAMKRAMELSIGSVKAGGKGQPSKLSYESEKGFAVENLRRAAFARGVLMSLVDSSGKVILADDDGDDDTGGVSTLDAFKLDTEISMLDTELLADIRDLPPYCGSTKNEWIIVLLRILRMNQHLVPGRLLSRGVTVSRPVDAKGKKTMLRQERGGVLRRVLEDGLKTVAAVPGLWRGPA